MLFVDCFLVPCVMVDLYSRRFVFSLVWTIRASCTLLPPLLDYPLMEECKTTISLIMSLYSRVFTSFWDKVFISTLDFGHISRFCVSTLLYTSCNLLELLLIFLVTRFYNVSICQIFTMVAHAFPFKWPFQFILYWN